MAVPPAILPEIAHRDAVRLLLAHASHNGFPVVDDRGKLVGLILRSQLDVLLAASDVDASPDASESTQTRLDLEMRTAHVRGSHLEIEPRLRRFGRVRRRVDV